MPAAVHQTLLQATPAMAIAMGTASDNVELQPVNMHGMRHGCVVPEFPGFRIAKLDFYVIRNPGTLEPPAVNGKLPDSRGTDYGHFLPLQGELG